MSRSGRALRASLFETLEPRLFLSAAPGFKLNPLNPIVAAVTSGSTRKQQVPNDPSFGSMWGLTKVQAPAAWDWHVGKSSLAVADIDSGIDYGHVDLYKNVWINQAEIPPINRVNLTDTDADGVITFWDLNVASNQGVGKIVDSNIDGRIDARDLLASSAVGGWADGINGVSYTAYTFNGVNYPADPYVDDIVGWNFAANNNNPFDGGTINGGHGTHTAGTIGAVGKNGVGVTGVAWKTRIMAIKIFADSGEAVNDVALGNAIRYAANNGAVAANASWGGSGGSNSMTDPLYASIKEAGDRKSMVFVAAAGNGDLLQRGYNNDAPSGIGAYKVFPSSYNLANIISVAATTSTDARASFSNWGPTSVDLAAPGQGILSTTPGNAYASYSGTSMATPHVTGAVVLLRSLKPNATYAQIKTWLFKGVDLVSSMAGRSVTGGRLNIFKAMQNVNTGAPTALTATPASATSITLRWTDINSSEIGFKVQRSTSSSFSSYTEITLATRNRTSYTDTGLTAGVTYYYRVLAYNLAGNGPVSNTAFATTPLTLLSLTDE
jgi:subtilisin family serine protease